MVLTAQTLARLADCSLARAALWVEHINAALARFEINTPARVRAFVAQVSHESGRFIYVREIWNPVQAPWQSRYEGRRDLGNVNPGDGARFRGRGLIQITGRANYRECGKAIGYDFEANPEALERKEFAALSAGWFWKSRGCNELADTGEFKRITRRINGGYNGLEDRMAIWKGSEDTFT